MPFAEVLFWNAVRNRQLAGVKIRRQCSIGNYVADFFVFEYQLAIEIDGDSHYSERGQKHDAKRTEFFLAQGITLIRFTNDEIINNLEGCLDALRYFLEEKKVPAGLRVFTPSSSP